MFAVNIKRIFDAVSPVNDFVLTCEYLWKKEAIFENAYVCQSGTRADGFVLCKRGREI